MEEIQLLSVNNDATEEYDSEDTKEQEPIPYDDGSSTICLCGGSLLHRQTPTEWDCDSDCDVCGFRMNPNQLADGYYHCIKNQCDINRLCVSCQEISKYRGSKLDYEYKTIFIKRLFN